MSEPQTQSRKETKVRQSVGVTPGGGAWPKPADVDRRRFLGSSLAAITLIAMGCRDEVTAPWSTITPRGPARDVLPTTIVQSAQGAGSAASLAVSFSSNNTAGNLIVVAISSDSAGATVSSVTDTRGNTYVKATDATTLNADHGTLTGVWYALNCAAGANTVTVTQSVGSTLVAIHEFSGVATSSAVDVTNTSVTTTTTPSVSATTTAAGDLVFGAIRNTRSGLTPSAGLTKDREPAWGEWLTTMHGSAANAGVATIGGTVDNGVGGVCGSHIVTFKAATVTAPPSTITKVQSASSAAAASSLSVGFASANTAGNLIVIAASSDNVAATITAVSDTKGNTYVKATDATPLNSDHGTLTGVWYATNCQAGANTVTVTHSAGNTYLAIHEFSGIATASALDVAASATGTTSTPSVSATTTASGDLVFGAIRNPRSGLTAGAGFTKDEEPAWAEWLTTEHKVASSTGSQTVNGTISTGGLWGAHVVTFKAGTAGGGGGTGIFRTPTPPNDWGAQARSRPPVTGRPHNVLTNADMDAALGSLAAGDEIVIQTGARLSGAWVLPNVNNAPGQWVTIRTAAAIDSVCPPGKRITPQTAQQLNLGQLATTTGGAPVIRPAPGAQGFYFIGIDFRNGYNPSAMIHAGNVYMTQASEMAGRIVFDRCVVSSSADTSSGHSTQRGIYMCGEYIACFDSDISDIYGVGDSQSILVAGWQGPYYIDNNHLEGWGENFMAGGAETSTPDIVAAVPSDLVFEHNHVYKKPQYFTAGAPFGDTSKNLFELKSLRRGRIRYNIFENFAGGGQSFAVNIKSVDQYGAHKLQGTQDIEFAYNWIRNVVAGPNISSNPQNPANAINLCKRIYLHDNLWEFVNTVAPFTTSDGNAVQVQLLGALSEVTIEHDTYVAARAGGATAFVVDGQATGPIAVVNNILRMDGYGLKYGSGGASGNYTWNTFIPNAANRFWQNNVLVAVGGNDASGYPQPSIARADDASVGYANLAGRDYTVTGTLATYATDGGPAGVKNFSGLMASLANVPIG
jgi:hypothetical protein